MKKIYSSKPRFRQAVWLILPLLGIMVGVSQIHSVKRLVSFAARKPANLKVDLRTDVGSLRPNWQYLAQGGETPEFSLAPLLTEMNQLKPKYIRIDHLYDFYIKVSRTDGKLVYDFTKLDKLLLEMKSTNTRPFISLSYMPDVLNPDITGVPSNWGEYAQIIARTIEHISGKNELDVANVYYEIWNEPDLFGQWKTYGQKNYLQLYRTVATAALSVKQVEPFKIGGPATTKLYDNWINNLANMVVAENLPLDFISWHHYSDNPYDYYQDTKRLSKLLEKYSTLTNRTEYILSEWGPNSENDPQYDTQAGAAHLVTSLAEMTRVVDQAYVFEVQDGKNGEGKEYWGRWGLYTHPDFGSHPKPRAEALKLLNQLGSKQLVVTGAGSSVKALGAKKGKTVQLMIANYSPVDRAEEVPVTFSGIPGGSYQIVKQYLGRSKSTGTVMVGSEQYSLTVPMPANSVLLLELTPTSSS